MAILRNKLIVDEEFGSQLKDFRNQYKVKAKDVAIYMNKSAAYISKLEKGEIHQIDKEEFVNMVNFISSSPNGYQLFCERIIGTMVPEALDGSTIARNFDWVDRTLPIPEEYCQYINKKLKDANIDITELTNYINMNDDLDERFLQEQGIDKETVEKNSWIPYFEADSKNVKRTLIIVEITEKEVENIVHRRIKKTSYLYLYVILYHIYKMQELDVRLSLKESERINIKRKTSNKLNDFKIYTLSDKAKVISQTNNETELVNVLNTFDIKNQELMRELIDGIFYLSEQDVEYTNSKLEGVLANLREEPSFSLAYMALPLDKMFNLSFKAKKEFLEGVGLLIEKCASAVSTELEKF